MKKWISIILAATLLGGCLLLPGCGEQSSKDTLDGKKLVVLGDSITAFGSWSKSVAKELNMYVYNAAKGGITSKQGLQRFEDYVVPQNPQYVTISFGMNDMIMEQKNKPKVSLEKYRENLTTLGNRTVEIGAVPLFLTVSYLDNDIFFSAQGQKKANYADYASPLAWLDEYNAVVREVAATNNWDMIDIRSACDGYSPKTFLSDGIHLADQGNQVYTDTIVSYMNEHFKRDKNAKPIDSTLSCKDSPAEAATTDIISYDPANWHAEENTMSLTQGEDGSLEIANTNGKWPDTQYIAVDAFRCPKAGSELMFDFTTSGGVATSILLFFNGATPDAYTSDQYVSINSSLPGVKIEAGSGDIVAGQTAKGSVALSDLSLPSGAYDAKGNVVISGVKIYAAGSSGKKVVVRQLAVATTGAPA